MVDYLKGVLAAIASFFLAMILRQLWWMGGILAANKATGITVAAVGFLESILSITFWVLAVAFLVFFYFSGRFENRILRLFFFWIPTIAISVGGFALLTLWAGMIWYTPR